MLFIMLVFMSSEFLVCAATVYSMMVAIATYISLVAIYAADKKYMN